MATYKGYTWAQIDKMTPAQQKKLGLAPLTGKEKGLGYKNLNYKAPTKANGNAKQYASNWAQEALGRGKSRIAPWKAN